MKKSELKDKTLAELKTLNEDLVEEYRNIRFQLVLGSFTNVSRKRSVRKDIAQVKTLLREYELGISKVERRSK